MNIFEIVCAADKVPGWMTPPELAWLASTAAALPEGAKWLEIGAWCGRSTLAVGLALPPRATLHVFDNASEFGKNPAWSFETTCAMIREKRPDVLLKFWPIDSAEIANLLLPNSCDVAFVDGNHSYSSVSRDCRSCEMVVKPGGLLCGHDYHEANPDVMKVVDELYPRRVIAPETMIWTWRL